MADGDLTASGHGGRVWAALAVIGVLSLLGVATASGSWTAGEPRVDFGQAVAASPVTTPAPTTPAPTPPTPASAATIDEYGEKCDLVADRLRRVDGTLTRVDRQQVNSCLADRLESRPKTSGAASVIDDLSNYFGSYISGYAKPRLVIVSEGPLAPSALARLGPIPDGVTVEQRVDGLSRSRMDATLKAGTNAIVRSIGDRAEYLTVILNAGADGRSITVDVSDDRTECTAEGYRAPLGKADLRAVERAARAALPALDVGVSAGCSVQFPG